MEQVEGRKIVSMPLINAIPPLVSVVTYALLSLAEPDAGLFAAAEKVLGSSVAGVLAYLFINYLMKKNNTLHDEIKELRKESNEIREKHHQEIVEILRHKN